MFYNYLKVTLRTLLKYRGYAFINLLGLSLGLTAGILILVFVLDELSFDQFHTRSDRIYRVGTDMYDIKSGGLNGGIEANGWAIGKLLENDFPEVEKGVYITNGSNLQINHDGKRFEQRIFYAGREFFEIFSFPLVEGNPESALELPGSVVLTESMAVKYFGGEGAMGKTLVVEDTLLLTVTGVLQDVPKQSHMQFDLLVSFATYETINKWFTYDGGWGNLNVRNYILLKEGVDKESFFAKARNLYMNYVEEDMKQWGMLMYLAFEPLSDIYLHTKRGNGMGPLGSMDRVYMVSGVAIFVVLLACINFINLSTARSTHRAKEVGLRKVVGSSRSYLVAQFLSESFVLTLFAFVLAVTLIGVVMPMFNQLLGKEYHLEVLLQLPVVMGVLLLIAAVTLLSGYYPALAISSMRPSEVLKGKIISSQRGVQLRRVLVVFQFVISAGLILCTLVVMDQLDYMQQRDLGFNREQIIVADMGRVPSRESTYHDPFMNDLKVLVSVESVSFTNAVPGRNGWVGQWAHAADRSSEESIGTEYMTIDENYFSTLGITLLTGRNFDLNRPADLEEGLILNETAVKKFGWDNAEQAIGKKIDSPSGHPAGTVIGVVKDYHQWGLQQQIYPQAMAFKPQYSRYFAIRFNSAQTSDLLAELQAIWKKYYDGYDFKYFFLDENFERQYYAEQRLSNVFTIFSIVTIIIAVIGLIGLVSFMVAARTKEIGIRKVLGADVLSITRLLSKEFLILVVVANLIAFPLAWYLTGQWLEGFAYRTTVGASVFAFTFVLALGTTVFTVGLQTFRAAMTDPVKSLRYE
jgi:putative ABC transport system permease protein